MTTGLPQASLLESARFTLTYALPSLFRGALIPQPFWTDLATRLNTAEWAVATIERLSERHGGRSVLLRGATGKTLLILTTEDIRRVLDGPVDLFAMDAREKQRALEPFAPDALNLSPPSLRGQRRPFNEAVLDYGHEPHRLAERFLAIVREEVTTMLSTDGVLDYDRALAAFRRINRRCVLGDAFSRLSSKSISNAPASEASISCKPTSSKAYRRSTSICSSDSGFCSGSVIATC